MIKFARKYWLFFILALLAMTPLVWFAGRKGFIVNGIDTNFPLDPIVWFLRRFYLWNNVPNGGIDHSSSVSGLFFHLIQVIPYILNFGLQNTQIVSFIFWFSLIVASSFWFSKSLFEKKPLVQILFTVLYTFNIFAFNAWENSKVSTLSLLASAPLLLNIFTLYFRKKIGLKKMIFLSSLSGIIASGCGVNPAYLVSLLFILAIYSAGFLIVSLNRKNFTEVGIGFIGITITLLLINSFWILPTFSHVFREISGSGSIDQIGFTNWVDSLSENTSILNVMRIQGLWDWYAFDGVSGTPLYIPYALNYFRRVPFLIFSFLIPALAIVSLALHDRDRKELFVSFSLMAAIGIFLGVGTHFPTGVLYRYLLDHLPFFSLFRSPWYIFTPLVIISYAGLICLLFSKNKLGKAFENTSILILIAGNLIYSYPLVTGKIFRPAKADGFYVKFPDYVLDFNQKLRSLDDDKRIIGYPDDEIEQFKWGYRGIESILSLFSEKEVLFSPLNSTNSAISSTVKEFYLKIKKEEYESAHLLADKLHAGYILNKEDQISLAPKIFESKNINRRLESGNWKLYDFDKEEATGKIFSPESFYFIPESKSASPLSVVPIASVVLYAGDTVIAHSSMIIKNSGWLIQGENSQFSDFYDMNSSNSRLSNRLKKRDMSSVSFTFNLDEEGEYWPILEKYRLEDYGIKPGNLEAALNGEKITLFFEKADDSFIYFRPIDLQPGNYQIQIPLSNINLASNEITSENSLIKKVGTADFKVLGESDNSYLSITNLSSQDASADLIIPDFDPLSPYLIQVEYKQLYGNTAQVLVSQHNNDTLVKTQSEGLPNYPGWKTFGFFFEPVKTKSGASVQLVSPKTKDPLGTTVNYDNLGVYKVFTNSMFLKKEPRKLGKTNIKYSRISPVLYEGESNGEKSQVIVFLENYSPNWKMRVLNEQGKVMPIEPVHFSANLYANAWYLDNMPERYKFEIFYEPQRLLNLGFAISGLTLLVSVGMLFTKSSRLKK